MSETAPHYFVITVGTTGDLHPFMRIASALQTLGRKATFITHSYYENVVHGAGLVVDPRHARLLDVEVRRLVAHPGDQGLPSSEVRGEGCAAAAALSRRVGTRLISHPLYHEGDPPL